MFLPLFCIYGFGVMVYAFPPWDLEPRLMLLTTMYLTVFAIQWTVHDRLPRTPHSTVVDEVVWNLVLALLLIALSSCIGFRFSLADKGDGDDDDPGWTDSRASKTDIAFLVFSLLCLISRGVFVHFKTIANSEKVGLWAPFKLGVGVGSEVITIYKDRAWRYCPFDKTHCRVDDVKDF